MYEKVNTSFEFWNSQYLFLYSLSGQKKPSQNIQFLILTLLFITEIFHCQNFESLCVILTVQFLLLDLVMFKPKYNFLLRNLQNIS